jgi:hypothetical protein
MRIGVIVALLGIVAAVSAQPGGAPGVPFPAWRVSVDPGKATVGAAAAEWGRLPGAPAITVPPEFAGKVCAPVKDVPFWDALDRLAAGAGLRVAVRDAGRAVELVPKGASREVVSTAGPFRVVARQVVGRALLAEGFTVHEVQLDVYWEPRYPVFLIDAYPHVTHAADDRGVSLRPQPAGSRTQPSGAHHPAAMKLDGVTREAKRIGVLKGSFAVTASEKLLPFRFDATPAKEQRLVSEKVEAVLTSWKKEDDTWEAAVELTYPPTLPEFQSFEAPALTTANRVVLVAPGGKTFEPDSKDVNVSGRQVLATYYFKEDRAKGLTPAGRGWALELHAASTPVEFRVPFELRDIMLP